MIVINKPYIESYESRVRLVCDILVDSVCKKVYLEVNNEYRDYLCYERGDAFLIVLFFYAMREKKNIICKASITEDLYYQITEYLMPIFEKNSHGNLKKIKIKANLTNNIENIGAVGTGITCGVDSFYTIYDTINHKIKRNRLTHLVIMSLADSYKKYGHYDKITSELCNKALLVANEFKLPVIIVNSNMRDLFPIPPMHTLIRMFGVYALQKLFGVYYFASGYPVWTFNLEDCSFIDSARYDLLLCKELSTKNLFIYSHGSQVMRMDKIRFISKYDLVRKNLHVCVKDSNNCSLCSKCIRTMACLDSLNKLDNFGDVFNVEEYYKNLDEYLRQVIYLYKNGDLFIYEFIDKLVRKYKNRKIFKNFEFCNNNICNRCYRISDYNLSYFKSKNRIIGVTGGSSSGKSTVVSELENKLEDVTVIRVDKYMIKYLDVYKEQIIEKLNIIDDGRHWCNYIYNSYDDVIAWVNILKKKVQEEVLLEISNCKSKNIIIDSFMLPLLDIYNKCNITIVVKSNMKNKLPRIKERLKENGRIHLFNNKALKNRLKYTAFDNTKYFDYELINNSTKNLLIDNIDEIITKIKYFDEV